MRYHPPTILKLSRWLRAITTQASRGVALIEAALAIPVIILFIGGAIDLGSLLVRYVSASKLSYEGARFAAQLQDLELTDAPPAGGEGEGGVANDPAAPDCDHVIGGVDPLSQVCRRVLSLMPENMPAFAADASYLRNTAGAITYKASRPEPCEGQGNNLVEPNAIPPISKVSVSVSLEWRPLLLSFLDVEKVTATTTAPYLGNKGADVTSCNRDNRGTQQAAFTGPGSKEAAFSSPINVTEPSKVALPEEDEDFALKE